MVSEDDALSVKYKAGSIKETEPSRASIVTLPRSKVLRIMKRN